jgi:hypothetical protein
MGEDLEMNNAMAIKQGSHGSWKFLESPGIFFLFFPGPGKSWKTGMVLEKVLEKRVVESWNFFLVSNHCK